MNCYICGSETDPRIDHRDGKLRPCSTCEHIIAESVEEMERRDEKEKRKVKRMTIMDDDEFIPFDDDRYVVDEEWDDGQEPWEIEYSDEDESVY